MPNIKPNLKKVHRLVILPDYQGIGIGGRLLDFIAKKYTDDKFVMGITTSAPSLIFSLKRHKDWKCYFFGRNTGKQKMVGFNKTSTKNRITAAFRYIQNGTK